jgi:hypothetical protein
VLVAAAVCPHPPLLVPGVGAGASAELDDLRVACHAAVATLVAADPDLLVVVGSADTVGPLPEGAWGSLSAYGVQIPVGEGTGPPTLPLSLTIGAWLLDRGGAVFPSLLFGVTADSPTDRAAALGAALAEREDEVAMLVMGDGSARRSAKGPGGLDPDAERFDAEVEQALGTGSVSALMALDPARARRLLVAGRAAWQVLAGAADGADWRGQVRWAGAPYGVSYLVATWAPRR